MPTQTKSQHTPGPWEAKTSFRANDWGVDIVRPDRGFNEHIATMPLRFKGHGPQSGHATQELQWANARLIAQAPRMLEIIQDLVNGADIDLMTRARQMLKEVEGS